MLIVVDDETIIFFPRERKRRAEKGIYERNWAHEGDRQASECVEFSWLLDRIWTSVIDYRVYCAWRLASLASTQEKSGITSNSIYDTWKGLKADIVNIVLTACAIFCEILLLLVNLLPQLRDKTFKKPLSKQGNFFLVFLFVLCASDMWFVIVIKSYDGVHISAQVSSHQLKAFDWRLHCPCRPSYKTRERPFVPRWSMCLIVFASQTTFRQPPPPPKKKTDFESKKLSGDLKAQSESDEQHICLVVIWTAATLLLVSSFAEWSWNINFKTMMFLHKIKKNCTFLLYFILYYF